MFKPTRLNTQKAFTLVELLTVMVVLVALASITVKTTAQFSFDSRYQITEDRYNKIKAAIIGTNQIINGHPSVSGFVADMGRLPSCIRELIDGSCDGSTFDTPWATGVCKDATSVTQPYYTANTCVSPNIWTPSPANLGAGWRGAYIETTNDPNNSNAFTDGWGRIDDTVNVCSNSTYTTQEECIANSGKWFNPNYGWIFDNSVSNQLTIKSYGKDQLLNGVEEYDKDFPENNLPTISVNDWLTNQNFNVTMNSTISIENASSINRPTIQINCESYGGIWNASGTPQCSNLGNSEYLQADCPIGEWNTTYCNKIKNSICIDFYYHNNGGLQKLVLNSPLNGVPSFTFLLTSANLPMGQAAFRITDCIGGIYPTTHSPDYKIVDIFPNRTLTFDW